jgi:hypothetical protein
VIFIVLLSNIFDDDDVVNADVVAIIIIIAWRGVASVCVFVCVCLRVCSEKVTKN